MVLNRVLVRGLTWKVPFAHPEPESSRFRGASSWFIDQYHHSQPNEFHSADRTKQKQEMIMSKKKQHRGITSQYQGL